MERADTPLPGPFRILAAGMSFIARHSGRLLVVSLIWIVLLAVIAGAAGALGISGVVLYLIDAFALAALSWFWHRSFLMGPRDLALRSPAEVRDQTPKDKVMTNSLLAFAWRGVGLAIILGACGAAVTVVGYLGFYTTERQVLITSIVGPAVIVIVLTFPIARILPAFAAVSVGERLPWIDAWRLARGAGWRLAAALVVIGLVDLFIGYLLLIGILYGWFGGGTAWPLNFILPGVIFAFATLVCVAVASACNAFVFRELTGWRAGATDVLELVDQVFDSSRRS